jgi:AcrR family transcriptional regulator
VGAVAVPGYLVPAGGEADAAEGSQAASRRTAARGARGARARRRPRNARGQGARLTDEIVAGALTLIEQAGSDEAVTLRAVAREVGIAAPSIYAHFEDRDAIVLAVVVRIFDELRDAIVTGVNSAGPDPVDRLVAGCAGYVAYGLDHPARYGVLFSGRRTAAADYCKPVQLGPGGMPVLEFGAESFALMVQGIADCVAAGVSASTDVVADATAVWVIMHGTVSLRTALPGFPWPAPDQFIREHVLSLARVQA